ncbi:hypothetical protein AURDEDRAFT_151384 [Auricularia subglabra TFB-10046 SS5]|nr:hypothetical protein AURDEDRAFT_151384 [Auricularia subglabra TFB-10046 SS5]
MARGTLPAAIDACSAIRRIAPPPTVRCNATRALLGLSPWERPGLVSSALCVTPISPVAIPSGRGYSGPLHRPQRSSPSRASELTTDWLSRRSVSSKAGIPRCLSMGQIIRRIQQLRSTYSVFEVLDMVQLDLQHAEDAPRPVVFTPLLGRDVYSVADLDHITKAVGTQPDNITWSILVNNALRCAGVQTAVPTYVEACRRGFRPETSTTNQLIGGLVNPTKFYQPDPSSIRRAVSIFLQQMCFDDKDDDSYFEALPLLRALVGSTAIPSRHTHVCRILDWMKLKMLPVDRDWPHLDPIVDSFLRCRSYAAAVAAVSRFSHLSPEDLKSILGTIARMRFAGDTFMSLADFAAFVRHWESCGHKVDASVFLTYLAGVRESLHTLSMPWEIQGLEKSGRTFANALRELKYHVYAFESFVSDRYATAADDAVYTALLYLLPAVGPIRDAGLFERLWDTLRAKRRPVSIYGVCAALDAAPSLDQAAQAWADFLDSGASPSHAAWTRYARSLLRYSRREEAFDVLKEHVGDDPEHGNGAIHLFVLARSSEELRRYAAALPRTWASPTIQKTLAQYRAHRRRIGRLPVALVSHRSAIGMTLIFLTEQD